MFWLVVLYSSCACFPCCCAVLLFSFIIVFFLFHAACLSFCSLLFSNCSVLFLFTLFRFVFPASLSCLNLITSCCCSVFFPFTFLSFSIPCCCSLIFPFALLSIPLLLICLLVPIYSSLYFYSLLFLICSVFLPFTLLSLCIHFCSVLFPFAFLFFISCCYSGFLFPSTILYLLFSCCCCCSVVFFFSYAMLLLCLRVPIYSYLSCSPLLFFLLLFPAVAPSFSPLLFFLSSYPLLLVCLLNPIYFSLYSYSLLFLICSSCLLTLYSSFTLYSLRLCLVLWSTRTVDVWKFDILIQLITSLKVELHAKFCYGLHKKTKNILKWNKWILCLVILFPEPRSGGHDNPAWPPSLSDLNLLFIYCIAETAKKYIRQNNRAMLDTHGYSWKSILGMICWCRSSNE